MSAPSSLDYGDDDTVELMLTPEQMRMLSRAANDEDLGPSPPAPPTAAPAVPATARVGLSHGWLLAGTVAVLGAAAILMAAGSGAHRTTAAAAEMPVATEKPVVPRQSMAPPPTSVPSQTPLAPPPPAVPPVASQSSVPAVPVEASTAAAPLPSATPATDPVRIRNPFDRSEVFEFPAGTSRQEARQAVADMLLQRALERHTR
jgi:hypothetical protein